MNLTFRAAPRFHLLADGAAIPVIAFVSEHQQALWHAARLLGGYEHARLVDRLVDALLKEARLTRQIRIMLDQVVGLLTLENVGDPERPETSFFALLDPADPAVEEICLLADGLRAAIAQAEDVGRAAQTSQPAVADAA